MDGALANASSDSINMFQQQQSNRENASRPELPLLTVDQCDLAIDLSELRQRVLEVTDLGDPRSPDLAVSRFFVRIGGDDADKGSCFTSQANPQTESKVPGPRPKPCNLELAATRR
jgi:hypothetical protein